MRERQDQHGGSVNDHSPYTTVPYFLCCVLTSAFFIAQFRVMLRQATFKVQSSIVMELEFWSLWGLVHSTSTHYTFISRDIFVGGKTGNPLRENLKGLESMHLCLKGHKPLGLCRISPCPSSTMSCQNCSII